MNFAGVCRGVREIGFASSMMDKLKAHKPDLGVIAFIGAFITLFFWKVIFLAQPISRVFLLAKRDVLFARYSTPGRSGFDESVFLLLAPYYRLVAHYWRELQMPLWNPYCGWGMPLLGDIQAAVFSPLRVIFALNPSMYQYNLLLVFEIFVAAVGTYLLTRHLRVSRVCALYAALTYALCPYILHFLELLSGTTSALLPWIFWLFVRLSTQPSLKRAVLCAAGCAVFIASGHPEASFIGVSFATLCMILVFANRKNVVDGFKWTAIVAAIALCVSAPIIIPFAEYFFNSDCYKIGHAATGTTPVAGILLNLLQPMYWGASPYLGCLCIAFVALALFVDGEKRATVLTFFAGCVVAFICICRPLFFAQLFDMTPASLVPGVYCTPVFLLHLAILSAFGADYFLEHLKAGKNKAFFVFAASLFIVCFLPAILNWCGFPFKIGNFDNGVKDMAFNSKTWLITIGLSLGISLLLILKNKTRIPALVLSLCIVALSLGSMAVDNRLSLPNQPAFNYDMIDPLPFLVEKGERVLALGFDVLCPNTNVAYRIASIGTHNVMQPSRYIDFIVAAGAKRTTFNILIDKVPISRLVDYCGVKYVVSLGPVYGQGDPSAPKEAVQMPEAVVFSGRPEIKLVEAKVAYEARTAEASGMLKFEVEKGSEGRFVFTAVVLDGKGNPAWFGGLCPVQSAALQSGEVKLEALVPITFKANEKFYIGLHVFDIKELKILTPVISNANPHLKTFGPVLCLGCYQFAEPDKLARDIHYRLISESGPQRVRVYENTRSLGRAYIVFAGRNAVSGSEALEMIKAKDFDGFREVILEDASASRSIQPVSTTPVPPGIAAPLKVLSANRLELDINSPRPGYLVLTDTYFPGWKAFVDDKEVAILRANYLFRAVPVGAGAHKVVFSYEPLSFIISAILFLIGLFVSALAIWHKDRN